MRLAQFIKQPLTHPDNPFSHPLHFHLPLAIQPGVGQYRIRNASTMNGRVRVHRSDYDLQLALHPCLLIRVGRRQRKRPYTFTVKAHILRKRLCQGDLMAL